jgi:prophage regulatory protein
MNTPSKKAPLKFIRLKKTIERSALSRSEIYRRMTDGSFAPTVTLGARTVAHIESEVDEVLAAMALGKNEEELKNLVTELVKQRQSDFA